MGTTRAGAGSSPRRSHGKHRKPDRSRLIALIIVATVWLFDSAARANAIDIIIDPDRVEKGTGAHVEFECVGATGKIRWKFNGIEYKGDGAGPGSADGPSKRILHQPDIADGGRYACSVDQEEESDEETLFVYTVPVVSSPPQNGSVHVGQDAQFSALLENFYGEQNRLLVSWQRDDEPPYSQIVNGTSHGIVNVTYTLKNASLLHNTTFQFTLFASYLPTYTVQFRLTVQPLTIVIPPSNLMFPRDGSTNSSFKLTWFHQEGTEPIDKFTFYYDSSTSSLREKEAGPRSFSLTFTGLSSCTTYEIYGIAVGTMGQVSQRSDVVQVTTRLTPLEDSQIWSDGDRVIVHYEGKSLPLCVTNNLTYHHHQVEKLCNLTAKLPQKSSKGGVMSAFETEMTFTAESSSFRSLLRSCLHEEESGCTGNGKLISLRNLCHTPPPTIAPDLKGGAAIGLSIGLVIGIIIVVNFFIIVIQKRRQETKRRRRLRSPFKHVSSPHVYEDTDFLSLARLSKGEDEEANRNDKVALETEPHPTGSSPSSPPERAPTPLSPLHPPTHLLIEKQSAALPSLVNENGEIKWAPRRGYHQRPSLSSRKSPSAEDSPLADAEAEDDLETERRPSSTKKAKPILKKYSPRGQMSLRSHSIDIHVSPPRDSNHPYETISEDAFASENNAIGLQDHNIMYDLLERVKVMLQEVDELVDEDVKVSRESLKKIEDILSLIPVHHHVRRSSEPLLVNEKSRSPPKQRPVNPSSPLIMPAPPSFEAFPASYQGKSRSKSQQEGSQSIIASVRRSVDDILKSLNDFKRKLDTCSAQNTMMSRLGEKVVNMDTEAKKELILRELTEIRPSAGSKLETEPDVDWLSHRSPAGLRYFQPSESELAKAKWKRQNKLPLSSKQRLEECLAIPASSSFEISAAPKQVTSQYERQRSSQPNMASDGNTLKGLNNLEQKLESEGREMKCLEAMETEVTFAAKRNQKTPRELTDVLLCVKSASTTTKESASIAGLLSDGTVAGNTSETEPDVSCVSGTHPHRPTQQHCFLQSRESVTEETSKTRSNQAIDDDETSLVVASLYSEESNESNAFDNDVTHVPVEPTSENLHLYVDEQLVTCLRKGTVSRRIGVEDKTVNVGNGTAYVGVIELLPHKTAFAEPVILRHELKRHYKPGSNCVETLYSLFYGEGLDLLETYDFMGSLESARRHFSYKGIMDVYLQDSYLELFTKTFCRYCSVVKIGSFNVVMSFFVRSIGVYAGKQSWNIRIAASCSCPKNLKKIQEDLEHNLKFSFVNRKRLCCRKLSFSDKQRLEFSLSEEDTANFTLLSKKHFSGEELLSVVENNDRLPNYLDKDCFIERSKTISCSKPAVKIVYKYCAEDLLWDDVLVWLDNEPSSVYRGSDSDNFSTISEFSHKRLSDGTQEAVSQDDKNDTFGSQTGLSLRASAQACNPSFRCAVSGAPRGTDKNSTDFVASTSSALVSPTYTQDPIVIPEDLDIVSEVGASMWNKIGRALLNCSSDYVDNMVSDRRDAKDSEKLLVILENWVKKEGENARLKWLLRVCAEVNIHGEVEKRIHKNSEV